MNWKIYCDGSCRNNGRAGAVGAYGYIILCNDEPFKAERGLLDEEDINTNNRAEMMAMIKGLKEMEAVAENFVVEVYSDSAYIVNAYEQGWIENWKKNGWITAKKTEVKNYDLWIELDKYFQNPNIKLFKVKGHSLDFWNNEVDKLAQEASLNAKSNRS